MKRRRERERKESRRRKTREREHRFYRLLPFDLPRSSQTFGIVTLYLPMICYLVMAFFDAVHTFLLLSCLRKPCIIEHDWLIPFPPLTSLSLGLKDEIQRLSKDPMQNGWHILKETFKVCHVDVFCSSIKLKPWSIGDYRIESSYEVEQILPTRSPNRLYIF